MAESHSHQALVNLLQNGLLGSENMYREVVESTMVDDFFSETSEEQSSAHSEKVRIASFDVGSYRPEEVEWKIEEGSICIRGKKSQTTTSGAVGSKFCRCIPIPDNIIAKSVTARFSVGGGLLVVEGIKQKSHPPLKRSTSKSAFYGDSHFSLSVDLGDGIPINTRYGVEDKPKQDRIQLF